MAHEIPILKSALKVFLKSLPVRTKFNICSFGSTHSFLSPKSRSYDSDSLKEAVAHVEDFAANYGGTEIQNAMKAAIDSRFADLDCEILLLTDGDIWRQQELFNYLNDTVGNEIRVFSLGIGGSVSSSLIEGVARAGKGFAQMVGEGEKFENKVVRMMKGALFPHVSDYTMEVKYEKSMDEEDDATWEMVEKVTDGLKVMLTKQITPPKTREEHQKAISLFDSSIKTEEKEYPLLLGNETENPYADLPGVPTPKLLQTPHQLPPLFPFARTTAYLLLSPGSTQRTPKSVILRGTSRQGPLYLEIPIQKLPESGRKIHQLAAKKAMQELEEGRGWIYDAKDSESGRLLKDLYPSCLDEIIQREAVRLGVQFQVGGKWCSFVGVSEDDLLGMKPSEDDIQYIESPVQGSVSSFDGFEFYASEGIECFEAEAEEAEESDEDMGFGFFDSSPLRTITPVNGAHRGRGDHPTLLPSQNRGTTTRSTPSPGLFGSISGCPHRGSQNIKYKQSSRSPPTKTGSTMASFSSTASAGPASRSGAAAVKSGSKAATSIQRNNKPVATDSDKVLSIIELQDFEGFWTDMTELASIMGVKEKVLSNKKESYWITLVVIAFLENKMDKEKETWDLVVCKARTWLEENRFQTEVLEAEARQMVQHGK